MSTRPLGKQGGIIAFALLVVVAATMAIVAGILMMNSVKSKQAIATSSTGTMLTMKQSALDFARQNKRLPTVAEFNALTQASINIIGRKAIYLVDDRFATAANLCSLSFDGLLQVNDCGSDQACASPGIVKGLAFVLIDGGQNVRSLADPVHQSSSRTTSSSITPASANQNPPYIVEIVRRYAAGTMVGPFGNPLIDQTIYDDSIEFGSTANLREAAGCNLVSQGDVIVSGGDLRILNTSPLPNATLGSPYSKAIIAYGMDAATYTFAVSLGALPPGLSLGIPAGKTVGISGTPTAVGTYNFTLTVTATAPGYSRSDSRPLSLTVVTCPNWVDTGPPQSVACPSGYAGAITRQLQTDSCSSATQTVVTSNTCACVPSLSDTGATRTTTPCPVGQIGSILEKEQIDSCTNNRTWVTVSNSCAPSLPTFAACTCRRIFGVVFDNTVPANPKCTDSCCQGVWSALVSKPPCPLFTGCTFPATCS